MKIMQAKIEDAELIKEITYEAFKLYRDNIKTANPYFNAMNESLDTIKKDIVEKKVFIALSGKKILGAIRLAFLTDELAYISRFAVNPNIHNQGVGAKLLQTAIDASKENGMIKIALHTNAKYYKLARYYYGKGFYVHSTSLDRGYIRALFIKDLIDNREIDLSNALKK